jgi:hypothetical protein
MESGFKVEETVEDVSYFSRCPGCGLEWTLRDELLNDDDVLLTGHIATFESLMIGWLQFRHEKPECDSTFTVEVGKFIDLYDGPQYGERKAGLDECPRHCFDPANLELCEVQCEFSYVRNILQLVREKQPEPATQV